MRYTDEQIRQNLTEWIYITGETKVRYIIHYCVGYYGCITKQILRVIEDLVKEDLLKWNSAL